METGNRLSNLFRKRSRKTNLRRAKRARMFESLEARQLFAADIFWVGDALQVSGSADNDFIALQQDAQGTRVYTEDAVFTELDGKPFSEATSISISGGEGDDVLLSYQAGVPVSLSGDGGNDFLYSDAASDTLDGGAGFDWEYSRQAEGLWEHAFGIQGLHLDPSHLTETAVFDEDNRIGLQVEVAGELDLLGKPMDVTGSVDISTLGVAVAVEGTSSDWKNAFGIDGLNLTDTSLSVRAGTHVYAGEGYQVALEGAMDAAGAEVSVSGEVGVTPESVRASLSGTVEDWNDAFGVVGLDLANAQVVVSGAVHADGRNELGLALEAGMTLEDATIDVAGSVDIGPDRIDARLHGSIDYWDAAFGVSGLALADTDLSVRAYSDRQGGYDFQVDLDGEMKVQETSIEVAGSVGLAPDRVDAAFVGEVDRWDDAFGISGLVLDDTELNVRAFSDRQGDYEVQIDLDGEMTVAGNSIGVAGSVALTPDGVEAALTGTVERWEDAFGVDGLDLQDTRLMIAGRTHAEGSDLMIGVDAEMELLGTQVEIGGGVEMTPEGVFANLSGMVAGEWTDAFGVDGLGLRDTRLSIDNGSAEEPGLTIGLDTDLKLFGSYVAVAGSLGIRPGGVDLSLSPPESMDFTDLLDIPGFSLGDAALEITAGTNGLEVAVESTMDMGGVDVAYVGAFQISKASVSASLTGRVDAWDNAFDMAGLNLEDVVLTLGAESGAYGASMFIGLGAGIHIGDKEVAVAGLVRAGSTGWDVAFRGSVDSLTSDDLIDFANTINQGADPNAEEIPEDALGDFEVMDAYINFAPRGGDEALGIEDGFGIGGEFYEDGELLASGEFAVDLEAGVVRGGTRRAPAGTGPGHIERCAGRHSDRPAGLALPRGWHGGADGRRGVSRREAGVQRRIPADRQRRRQYRWRLGHGRLHGGQLRRSLLRDGGRRGRQLAQAGRRRRPHLRGEGCEASDRPGAGRRGVGSRGSAQPPNGAGRGSRAGAARGGQDQGGHQLGQGRRRPSPIQHAASIQPEAVAASDLAQRGVRHPERPLVAEGVLQGA